MCYLIQLFDSFYLQSVARATKYAGLAINSRFTRYELIIKHKSAKDAALRHESAPRRALSGGATPSIPPEDFKLAIPRQHKFPANNSTKIIGLSDVNLPTHRLFVVFIAFGPARPVSFLGRAHATSRTSRDGLCGYRPVLFS